MKKLAFIFIAIAITAGTNAQTDSASRYISPRDYNNSNDGTNRNRDLKNNANPNLQTNQDLIMSSQIQDIPYSDGVIMQDGRMMEIKNGKMILLYHKMTMNNGTKIMSDGSYMKSDGTKLMLKEGEHIDQAGNLIPMKNSNPIIK